MPLHIKKSIFFLATLKSTLLVVGNFLTPNDSSWRSWNGETVFRPTFSPLTLLQLKEVINVGKFSKKLNQDRVSSTFSCRKSETVHFVEKLFSSHIKLSILI